MKFPVLADCRNRKSEHHPEAQNLVGNQAIPVEMGQADKTVTLTPEASNPMAVVEGVRREPAVGSRVAACTRCAQRATQVGTLYFDPGSGEHYSDRPAECETLDLAYVPTANLPPAIPRSPADGPALRTGLQFSCRVRLGSHSLHGTLAGCRRSMDANSSGCWPPRSSESNRSVLSPWPSTQWTQPCLREGIDECERRLSRAVHSRQIVPDLDHGGKCAGRPPRYREPARRLA